MKVRVTLVIDVDVAAWREDYGTEPSRVREDVKSYVLAGVKDCSPSENGIFTDVSLARS